MRTSSYSLTSSLLVVLFCGINVYIMHLDRSTEEEMKCIDNVITPPACVRRAPRVLIFLDLDFIRALRTPSPSGNRSHCTAAPSTGSSLHLIYTDQLEFNGGRMEGSTDGDVRNEMHAVVDVWWVKGRHLCGMAALKGLHYTHAGAKLLAAVHTSLIVFWKNPKGYTNEV